MSDANPSDPKTTGGDPAAKPTLSRPLKLAVVTAAVLGGTMRAPLTATLFAVELTGNHHVLVPVMTASAVRCTAGRS